MSLVAHWPLNGDLLDYSGNGFHLTNNGATISSNGKIGSCYETNGTDNYLKTSKFLFEEKFNPEFSISINFKLKKNETGFKYLFTPYSRGLDHGVSVYNNKLRIEFTKEGDIENKPYYISNELEINKWYHLIVTLKNNFIKCYLNNEIKINTQIETTIGSWFGNIFLGQRGNNTFFFNGFLNDFKVFNHELSKKEISELYKTKILDWKFNECEEPTVNLIKNNYEIRNINQGLTFELIEQGINYKKYSISGQSNNTDYPYTIALTGATNSKRDKRQSISFQLDSNCFNKFSSDFYPNIVNINWKPGRKFSLIKNNNIYFYKVENLAPDTYIDGTVCDNYSDSIFLNSKVIPGQTFDKNKDYIILKNFLLEEKDHSTEFTPNERVGKIIDSSGYKNHGVATLENTPKWENKKFIFNGTNFINTTKRLLSNHEQSWTVISKIKLNDLKSPQYLNDFNLGCRILHTGSTKALNYLNSGANDMYRYSNNSLEINKEYEIAFVYNYKNNRIDVYLNGELNNGNFILNTNTFTKNPSGIKDITKFFEGFNGECSRVRVFAIDLSSQQIKEEYQNSLVIDKKNNLYCNELILKNNNFTFDKQGKLFFTNIQETFNQPKLFEYKVYNGKKFGLIFYHNCVNGTILFDSNKDNFLNCNEEHKKSLLSKLEMFRINGKFEFLLEYDDIKNQYNHWEQTSNPTLTNNIEGYKEINCPWKDSYWNGISLSTENYTWIDGSPNFPTWYYAIGSKVKHLNGIPNNNSSTGSWVKLWVRINDSIEINKNNNLICNEIREV